MSRSVSVPEKTLEHWSSQYITYRYRSKAALWWPTRGEDIDIGSLSTRPGKTVQLELKTTTVAGAGLHDVKVDLGQLWEYCQRPLWHQPFYAFPQPDWDGNLISAARAHGYPVTELGFSRSGSGIWFADWMILMTAAEVAAVLRNQLIAHGSPERGNQERLVRFDLRTSATTWGAGTTPPAVVARRQYWPEIEECGRPGWPQLIRVPARLAKTQGFHSASQVIEMLREAKDVLEAGDWHEDEPLITLGSGTNGNYEVVQTAGDAQAKVDVSVGYGVDSSEDDTTNDIDDHRLIVFLDARTLLSSQS